MICVFSHWVEAFPCRRATALTVGKLLLGKKFSDWEIPSELHDQGSHITGQIIKYIYNIWRILQHFHCAYHSSLLDWWSVQMVQLTLN